MPPSDSFCPYVGLQPYTEAEREYFFGRERDRQIITSNLYAAPLTVLYGASGVGKSSILLAGVVPHLREASRTAVVIFRAWQDASFLVTLKNECLNAVALAQKKPVGIDPNLPFDEFLRKAADSFRGSILILLDQFEEYFLYHPETQADLSFDAEFARAVNREEVDASFLISIREDSLSKLDRYRARIPNLLGNMLRLQHLDAKAAREAICRPLDVYNKKYPDAPVSIEDDLVQEIIEKVQTEQVMLSPSSGLGQTLVQDASVRIETPFLQLVMTRLWEAEVAQGSHVLHLQTLKRLGGAQVIVRTHLDSVMSKLKESDRKTAAIFFQYLVTPGGNKITLSLSDLSAISNRSPEAIAPILKTLEDERVLRFIHSLPNQLAATSYEIFHDVLAPAVLDWRRGYMVEQKRQEEIAGLKKLGLIIAGVLFLFAVLLAFANQQKTTADQALAIVSRQDRSVLYFRAIMRGHTGTVSNAEFSPDGRYVVTGSYDNTARVWDASTGNNIVVLPGSSNSANAQNPPYDIRVAFNRNGKYVATGNYDATTASVWDASTGSLVAELRGHASGVTNVAFSPDGKLVVTASADNTARVWEASTGKSLAELRGHTDRVNSATFSPDGKLVVTASGDNTARVWETSTGKTLAELRGHKGTLSNAEFSSDGKLVVTSSQDNTARIWEASTGKSVAELSGHKGPVSWASFSPDGKLVITGSYDSTARVWQVENGKMVAELRGHTAEVVDVAFSPDGKSAVTASFDDTARVWQEFLPQPTPTLSPQPTSSTSIPYATIKAFSVIRDVRVIDVVRPEGKTAVTTGSPFVIRAEVDANVPLTDLLFTWYTCRTGSDIFVWGNGVVQMDYQTPETPTNDCIRLRIEKGGAVLSNTVISVNIQK